MCVWRAHIYILSRFHAITHPYIDIIMSLTLAFTCFAAHAPSRAYGILPTHVPNHAAFGTCTPGRDGHIFACALCVVRVSL